MTRPRRRRHSRLGCPVVPQRRESTSLTTTRTSTITGEEYQADSRRGVLLVRARVRVYTRVACACVSCVRVCVRVCMCACVFFSRECAARERIRVSERERERGDCVYVRARARAREWRRKRLGKISLRLSHALCMS